MHSLERDFAAFTAVPQNLHFHQKKSVVIADQRAGGRLLLEDPELGRFAARRHFRIRACRRYLAKTKGKVERQVRYLRGDARYGRIFFGDADLADRCARWPTEVGDVRVHGTAGESPLVRFWRDGRPTPTRARSATLSLARRAGRAAGNAGAGPCRARRATRLADYAALLFAGSAHCVPQ